VSSVTVYAAPAEKSGPRFCHAFAQGAGGAPIATDARLRPGEVALFGSPALWDLLLQARDDGRTWYYGDHAYFGRGQFYRVTRNALQAGPELAPPADQQARARAEAVLRHQGVQVRPWRRGGGPVLVCPPGPVYASLMRRAGYPIGTPEDWLRQVGAELAQWTDRAMRVRSKADFRGGRPLAADLADAWAVVTFTSNVAVEAALEGVPVFVLGPAAGRAFGRGRLDHIEDPFYPENRHELALSLAAQQWTLGEIAAGCAWRALC
jgi:hypothetical protein